MSSISKIELERIVEQRLSPQYVSVHATDPEVRRYLLGRKRPDDVLAKMRYLADNGIELHAQIVLCPAINDEDILRRTADDLAKLHPALTSVAVVPVVFTALHNYKHLLKPVTGEYSRNLIKQVQPWQQEFKRRLGGTFLFLADEFYLRAGLPLPGASHYGDYPQIEDGVGMVRRFIKDATRILKAPIKAGTQKAAHLKPGSLAGTVATGELFFPTLSRFIELMNERFGTRLHAASVPNKFFGEEVTVAGLITGGDIIAARDRFRGRFLIVPEQACLKSGNIFLDDSSLTDIQTALGMPVSHGGGSLKSLIDQAQVLEGHAFES